MEKGSPYSVFHSENWLQDLLWKQLNNLTNPM